MVQLSHDSGLAGNIPCRDPGSPFVGLGMCASFGVYPSRLKPPAMAAPQARMRVRGPRMFLNSLTQRPDRHYPAHNCARLSTRQPFDVQRRGRRSAFSLRSAQRMPRVPGHWTCPDPKLRFEGASIGPELCPSCARERRKAPNMHGGQERAGSRSILQESHMLVAGAHSIEPA